MQAGESLHEALARELEEELGVRTLASRPLLQLAHDYPARRVVLYAREVRTDGEPVSREGQALRWVDPNDRPVFDGLDLLEADGPIVTAMRLPSRYLISPPSLTLQEVPALFERATRAGIQLLQLRQPHAHQGQLRSLAAAFSRTVEQRSRAGQASPAWVLGGDPSLTLPVASSMQLAGLHLPARALDELSRLRALADERRWWLLVSCHDEQELRKARAGGADAAVLGPVLPTPSHPQATGLGWSRFAALIGDLALPVYAIGGMQESLLGQAWEAGAQGVAGIRGLAPLS